MNMKRAYTILHTESSAGWGGQEIRILTEARGMMQRGCHVIILCNPHAKIYTEAQKLGIEVAGVCIEKKNWKSFYSVFRWMKANAHRFDLINTHSSTDSWLVSIIRTLLGLKQAIVRTRHVSTPISNRITTRWLYMHGCEHIVTTGEKLRQTLISDNKFPASHITSVRTGIDLSRYCLRDKQESRQALGLEQRGHYLGIVATLRSWKGHSYLLQAWVDLMQDPVFSDWTLLIVGDGPQRENLENQVNDLNLSNSVKFVGNQDNVEMWLSAMDLFCLPSYGNEGVPQGIMQAMACGLPVVSTTVGAIGEVLTHEDNGLIVEPRNIQQLRDALHQLMSNDEMRNHFSENAYRRAQTFADTVMLDRMDEIFREAMTLRQN